MVKGGEGRCGKGKATGSPGGQTPLAGSAENWAGPGGSRQTRAEIRAWQVGDLE